ncbi:MAG TPA: quinolinate synthase NadA [Vicinamibacterales bacterium]|nr:quinolinate synthase NadA [Vicinamibacterales bacterium]
MHVQLLTDYENTRLGERQPLPEAYLGLSDDDMDARITRARATLGDRLVILGHHYQRDEVIKFADFTGDSLKLAQLAARQHHAEVVVFCGVHFMAESADILGAPHQTVILPDLAAGCSMADMAAIEQLEVCWYELAALGIETSSVIPVTYINSTAAIKGFCGEHAGLVCTSSNAAAVMAWAWDRGEKLLMLPDQHLGRNTAYRMGVPLDQMVVWDPELPFGGVDREALERARLLLWKGHCSVHTRFSVRHIDQFRRQYPGGRVVVHPECTFEVAEAADEMGSTEFIIRTVSDSPPGSAWAVGTELHLVNRLARQLAPARTVTSLDSMGCLCSTMFRVSPNHLLWVLEGLVNGEVHNPIVVPEPTKQWARVALDRMLDLSRKD